jgi:hypothetical protein
LVAVGERAVADDVALVVDVVGAERSQRRSRDELVGAVGVAVCPERGDDGVVVGVGLVADGLVAVVDFTSKAASKQPPGPLPGRALTVTW